MTCFGLCRSAVAWLAMVNGTLFGLAGLLPMTMVLTRFKWLVGLCRGFVGSSWLPLKWCLLLMMVTLKLWCNV